MNIHGDLHGAVTVDQCILIHGSAAGTKLIDVHRAVGVGVDGEIEIGLRASVHIRHLVHRSASAAGLLQDGHVGMGTGINGKIDIRRGRTVDVGILRQAAARRSLLVHVHGALCIRVQIKIKVRRRIIVHRRILMHASALRLLGDIRLRHRVRVRLQVDVGCGGTVHVRRLMHAPRRIGVLVDLDGGTCAGSNGDGRFRRCIAFHRGLLVHTLGRNPLRCECERGGHGKREKQTTQKRREGAHTPSDESVRETITERRLTESTISEHAATPCMRPLSTRGVTARTIERMIERQLTADLYLPPFSFPRMSSDAASAAACARGDPAAFDALYVRHVKGIYAFIFYRTMDRETAEDLTSQTFLKALEKIGSYDARKGAFSTWLYRIARNTVTDHFRMRRPQGGMEEIWDLPAEDNPFLDADQAVANEHIHRALAGLDRDKRDLVLMRLWEGLSYQEIAERTGKTEAAAKMMFSRTMGSLRDTLAPATLALLLTPPFTSLFPLPL